MTMSKLLPSRRPSAVKRTLAINAWESRWPINTYRARDAGKLSKSMLDRIQAEAMIPTNIATASRIAIGDGPLP
jgi:hypothetical protein